MQPVSIVIPVWNNIQYLDDLFSTLKAKTKVPYELIIIDNGSTDGSQAKCKAEMNQTDTFIQNLKNNGSTGAWNQGIRVAKHEIICLLNSDVKILMDGWLETFQKPIVEQPDKVGIVECLEIIYDGTTRWAGAACPLINKRMTREIGLFDEKNLWGFCGDTDYWVRAHWNKWQFGWIKKTLIWHLCGGTHRRGILKPTQNKDWEEGNKIVRLKWNPKTLDRLWNEHRSKEEIWLKQQRAAGRLS